MATATPRQPRTSRAGIRGIVWKRSDFRESSRLITLITAEHGKLVTLGKGAHRGHSQCLGRIDFLNLVEVKMSGGRLPVLHRVRLLHEHRRLREPGRYIAAGYLAEILDPAVLAGRGDAGLFELLTGGLKLLERCPVPAIPTVLAGLELRYLDELGLQPPLLECSQCGRSLDGHRLYPNRHDQGLHCREHARGNVRPIQAPVLRWLHALRGSPSRSWSSLDPLPAGARRLLGDWITTALERHPRWRAAAYRAG